MRLLLIILSFGLSPVSVLSAEFLDSAAAFRPTIRFTSKGVIELRFEIADGYYLYRDKITVSPVDTKLSMLPPQFPKGSFVDDENFGKIEVYYRDASIVLRIQGPRTITTPVNIRVVAQGCAEAGLCYPPKTYYLSAK